MIVISTSLGSSLVALLAANRPEWAKKIAGHIMISPNFKIADPDAFLLNWPWARTFVPWIIGDQRGEKSKNPNINHGWTLPHSTLSLMPMAKITSEVSKAAIDQVTTPALFIYSPNDQVVSAKAIEEAISKWGGPGESVILERSGHKSDHVIVGDILSPSTTEDVIKAAKRWLNTHY